MAGELSVYPPIYRLGALGRWIREKLMAGSCSVMIEIGISSKIIKSTLESINGCEIVLHFTRVLGILSGTPVLLRIQSLRTAPVDVSMGVVSFLGEEEFYTLLVVLILWVCDARLGRLLSLLMAISFYVTGELVLKANILDVILVMARKITLISFGALIRADYLQC